MVYMLGDTSCELSGIISNALFEKMDSEKLIKEIDQQEIIEKYYKHVSLIQEVQLCKYYEIKNEPK